MNYLCHARDCLDRPFELVGTILPDWLRVLVRSARLRPWMVSGRIHAPGSPGAEIQRGLQRHFEDDAWFHASPVFAEVSAKLTRRIRRVYPDLPAKRMRASFYAHILLEMLLDSWLMEELPHASRDFSAAIAAVGPGTVAAQAALISPCPIPGLDELARRFTDPALIEGYQDDVLVYNRLDRMGRHVGQPGLPTGMVDLIASARDLVRSHGKALLTRP